MAECKSAGCGQRIAWARTVPGGRAMPVNAGSAGDPDGTLAVWRQDGKLLCRVLKKGEEPGQGQWRGVAHWTTCAKAAEHRKRAGWRHDAGHHRWEYVHEDGEVGAWIHDARLAEADWPDVLAQLEARHPEIPPLPDEARPPQQGALR